MLSFFCGQEMSFVKELTFFCTIVYIPKDMFEKHLSPDFIKEKEIFADSNNMDFKCMFGQRWERNGSCCNIDLLPILRRKLALISILFRYLLNFLISIPPLPTALPLIKTVLRFNKADLNRFWKHCGNQEKMLITSMSPQCFLVFHLQKHYFSEN